MKKKIFLVKILKRARALCSKGEVLFATPALKHFLENEIEEKSFFQSDIHLSHFSQLDDQDIFASIKAWRENPDRILSALCKMLTDRNLYKVEITMTLPDAARVDRLKESIALSMNIIKDDASYFVFTDVISNRAYNAGDSNINILLKNNTIIDIAKASDLSNLESLDKTVKKHILCYPRII